MRKGSDLIGKHVIAFDTGRQINTINDLIFSQETNRLLGFVVDEGGWFADARILPLENIESIGPDAVMIPSERNIVDAPRRPEIQSILKRNNILKGTRVMTTDGRDLGTLSDLYFDERNGRIEGYEVSGGLFADAYSGRSFLPAAHTFTIGEDAAFVPPEVATLMTEQDSGGIKGALHSAGDQIQNAAQQAGENLEQFGDRAAAKMNQARQSIANRAVPPSEQREFVLGKVATEDVAAPDGALIAARGQRVTPLAVEAAERHGLLERLYRVTGGSLAGQAVDQAAANFGVEQARGRRVHEPVRTAEGVFIAAPGQIVTDQVIQRARQYGRERELLEAVGLVPRDAARGGAARSVGAAGDRIAAGAEQITEGAASLWDKIKSKVGEMQEESAEKLEQRRIDHAIGRPVTRVILDRQDNVILNTGEIITHQAVMLARQAGVLGPLLDSVYDKDPQFAPEATVAPEPGKAALDQQEREIG